MLILCEIQNVPVCGSLIDMVVFVMFAAAAPASSSSLVFSSLVYYLVFIMLIYLPYQTLAAHICQFSKYVSQSVSLFKEDELLYITTYVINYLHYTFDICLRHKSFDCDIQHKKIRKLVVSCKKLWCKIYNCELISYVKCGGSKRM